MRRKYWGVTALGQALQDGEITRSTPLEDIHGNQYSSPRDFIAALTREPLRKDSPFPVITTEKRKQ